MFFQKIADRIPGYYRTELHGDRVTLRPPQSRDFAEWRRIRDRDKGYLQPFEPSWPEDATSQDFYERRLSRQKTDWLHDRAYSFFVFVDHGRLVGGLNVNHVCRGAAQYATLGYWLAEDAQGQGYMTEALRETLKFAATPLGLHRMQAAAMPSNPKSMRLLERLGFDREGFAREYVCINGVWADHHLYGRTLEEFRSQDSDPGQDHQAERK